MGRGRAAGAGAVEGLHPLPGCHGSGTGGPRCCKAARGTRPATCSRHARRSSRGAPTKTPVRIRPRSRASTTTGPRAGRNRLRAGRGETCVRVSGPFTLRGFSVRRSCSVFMFSFASAQQPNLGKPISEADVAAWAQHPARRDRPAAGNGTPSRARSIRGQVRGVPRRERQGRLRRRARRRPAADVRHRERPRLSRTSGRTRRTIFDFTAARCRGRGRARRRTRKSTR